MAKSKSSDFKDTLGKRDVVINLIKAKRTLAEICVSIGATREDLDTHYADLIEKYHPLEYIPTEEDRKLVWRSAAYGMTQAEIAARLGISSTTLRNHYRRELDTAKLEWVDSIADNLTTIAKGVGAPAVSAGQFLLRARAGWKETTVSELTGKDGGPIQTEEIGAMQQLKQRLMTALGKSDER